MVEPRFVFDANVVVSAALLPRSVPRRAIETASARGTLILSAAVVEELERVLSRKSLDRYVSEESRFQFLAALVRGSILIDVAETVAECRDPKDNKYLELAISGRAECLISGDDDLLVLNPFRGIPIVTPRAFLDLYGDPVGPSANGS